MRRNVEKILLVIGKITRVMLEIGLIYLAHTCNTELMVVALKIVVIIEFLIELYRLFK